MGFGFMISFFSIGKIRHVFIHPVLRSSIILSASLLLGMTGMTWFATEISSNQTEVNSRVKSIVHLKNVLARLKTEMIVGQQMGGLGQRGEKTYEHDPARFKKWFRSLDCVLGKQRLHESCGYTALNDYLERIAGFKALHREWVQLTGSGEKSREFYAAFFAREQTQALLSRFDQFLSNQLSALFLEASLSQTKFRTITLWVWVIGVGLLAALLVGHVVPVMRYTRKIERNERLFRGMCEYTPTGMLWLDQYGMIKNANPAALKILGVQKINDITDRYFQSFLTDESRQEFQDWLLMAQQQPVKRHGVMKCQKGEGIVGHLEVYLNYEPGENQIQLAFIDVTAKQQAMDQIKQYLKTLETKFDQQVSRVKAVESRYRKLFESTPAGLFLYDNTGKIIQANSVARQLFQSIQWDLQAEDYHPVWGSELLLSNILKRMGKQQRLSGEEVHIHCPDGEDRYLSLFVEPFPLDENGQQGYLCTFFDITPHVKLEKKLTRLTNYFQTIFNNTTDGIVVYDKDNVIIDVNHRLCELSGFSREELLGRGCFHLFCKKDDPAEDHECVLEQLISGKPMVRGRTVELIRKNGDKWIAEVDGSLLYDENGQFIGTIQILRDVTAKVMAERQQKVLEEQLQQSQKMEVIGQLAGGVAHDFNNILTVIKGFADFALMVLSPQHPAYNYIQKIIAGANSAANLTSQLLSFSRRKVLRLEAVNLNDVVYQSMDFIQRTLGEKIKIEIQTTPEAANVQVDKTAMQQIITNLCINARDAMPNGGELKITTAIRKISRDYPLLPPELPEGDYVMLSISDTGVGIPREIQDRIFEPFFTTKKPGRGTGLGLSMVYGLVKQQNGFITVYSEEGKGTEFKLFFPLSSEVPAPETKKQKRANLRGTGKILVAEDEPLVLEVLESTLNQYGYTVLIAKDGKEAWELFQQHQEDISLVIFDAIMPEMSGDELLEKIQHLKPDMPLICISGYSEEGIHQNFILKEGLEYLEKPFSPETILQKIKEVLKSK